MCLRYQNLGELQNWPKTSVPELKYPGELHFWVQEMFQIMKLGELQCGPKHCFRNLGELQNGPKSSIVSEIEYLGELLF